LKKIISLIQLQKKILEVLWDQDLTVQEIIKKENLEQISNEDELLKIIMKIIEENPKQHNQYKSGKDKLFGFFVGQVMKETQGSADPKVVNEILRKELNQ
jgi:aspartyl-tRNA(Asn)/glutamyl-tRNA(Gln) amidotransferase subunit B